MKKGKGSNKRKRLRFDKRLKRFDERLKQQADNRRKLISKLDRETALALTQDFAKLGLYQ